MQIANQSSTPSLAILPAAFMLGVFGAVSSCCNLAVIAAISGYSGSLSGADNQKSIWQSGLFFMVGTILAMAAVGAVIGLGGNVAGASLGVYWKLFAGLIMVMFGLLSLDLLPFRLPSLDYLRPSDRKGFVGSMVYGLALGGGSTACSVGCNPVLVLALGYVTLKGETAWGAAVLGSFALGYSLPLGAGMVGLGLGLGRLRTVAVKAAPVVKIVAGALLIGIGFYFLATI